MPSATNPYADAHLSPSGVGDARPTALQVIHDEGLVNKLVGKAMLVTGASSGIGIDTVAALHATGADVYMQVRDMKKGKEVMDNILASSEGTGKIDIVRMELDSFESIRAGVEEFLKRSNKLHVLVNNAGEHYILCLRETSMLELLSDAAIKELGIPQRA
jgi:NAD(P)-dependent dehydrogenase (short-subunit alcohol dehydrogenase family)